MLNLAGTLGRIITAVAATGLLHTAAGAGCINQPPKRPTVVVYGDSLTPVADYKLEAQRRGLDLTSHATGGTWMCGAHAKPQTDAGRWWPKILETITKDRPDYLILQYQAWANYQLRCGGRPAGFPYNRYDPGQGWRVYLDMFRIAANGRTQIIVVETPSAPADMPAWVEPQAIIDQASRVMAARHPGEITFVPIRHLTTNNGRWTQYARCLPIDATRCGPNYRNTWPAGHTQLRAADRIHYWCPTNQGVCPTSTPAGNRIATTVLSRLK